MPDKIASSPRQWLAGSAPVCVVMITLNEAHNLGAVLENLAGWARQIIVVDSYSKDATVSIAVENGVQIVQRPFRGFGDQWNFAVNDLSITQPWTMKLDPDERLTPELKANLEAAMSSAAAQGLEIDRRLWFMGRPLPVRQRLLRLWRTGVCRFSDVAVNEHPIVAGELAFVVGDLEHHDSPNLEHWLDKQNRYSTVEAETALAGTSLSAQPKLLGSGFERRMWMKKNFRRLPLRFVWLFLYNWLWLGTWRAGRSGYIWARLRSDVMRIIEYKRIEMEMMGLAVGKPVFGVGQPDDRVPQYD